MKGLVGLKIPSKLDIEKLDTIDFSWDEIFIIDVQLEIKFCEAQIKILEGAEEWAKESDRYQNQINYLKKYCDYKKIKL